MQAARAQRPPITSGSQGQTAPGARLGPRVRHGVILLHVFPAVVMRSPVLEEQEPGQGQRTFPMIA